MFTRENLDKWYLNRIPYPTNYIPTSWVKSVINNEYRSSGIIYKCIGYDPECGFWMEDPNTKELKNISERAIDRTFHKIRS